MRMPLFPKLAMSGIKRNKKLYLPFLLTCILMVSIYYIIAYLSVSETVAGLKGGRDTQQFLRLGKFVMTFFAVLFLFYTSSFLTKRRKKEFALYNILGMNKKNLARILCFETLFCYVVSVVVGLLGGVALSKLSELILMKIGKYEVVYGFSVDTTSLWTSVLFFGGIFVLIMIDTLRQIFFTNTIKLMQSERIGEKPPKANYVLGILGTVTLIAAYYIAVSIKDPLPAVVWFFFAVLLVIAGTYILFIFGSVLFCRIMQKNKRYYYKKNHFVFLSSMSFRMKRNGAGLASICILLTMTIVMGATATCLYIGMEDSVRTMVPKGIVTTLSSTGVAENDGLVLDELKRRIENSLPEGVIEEGTEAYSRALMTIGEEDGKVLNLSENADINYEIMSSLGNRSRMCEVGIIDIETFNRLYSENKQVSDNDVILVTLGKAEPFDTVNLVNITCSVKENYIDDDGEQLGIFTQDAILNTVVVVVDNLDYVIECNGWSNLENDADIVTNWEYNFDTKCDIDEQREIENTINGILGDIMEEYPALYGVHYATSREITMKEQFGSFSGLFFIAILLSIVFLVGAALIIYYKQISEGYEDRARFDIMQKVGMTKKDIKKTINSQMITVFLLPIVFAAVHMAFAFNVISKLLMLVGLVNNTLFILVTLGVIILCAVIYIIIYKITSNSYYSIVAASAD